MNARLLRVTNTVLNKIFQLEIKAIASKSTYTAEDYGPYGTDSRPPKNATVIYITTERNGDEAIIGVLNKGRKAEIGEHRIFSTNADRLFKFNIWLTADGKVRIGNSDAPADYTNFATRYNELKTAYDKTVQYLTTLKLATKAVAVAVDAIAPGTSAAFDAAMAGQTTGDISEAKADTILLK
jgi:hypothetical protein